MYKRKQPSTFTLILTTIFLFIMGAFVFHYERNVIFGNYKDFYELEESDSEIMSGQYVSLKVKYVLNNYFEIRHYTNFIPTGKDEHYIILLESGNIISLKTNKKSQIKQLDEICDDTIEYLSDTIEGRQVPPLTKEITIKGTISSIDFEIEQHYIEILDEIGFNDEEYVAYRVEIDATNNRATAIFVLCGISICFILSIIALKKKLE